jgi:hypothetical protein
MRSATREDDSALNMTMRSIDGDGKLLEGHNAAEGKLPTTGLARATACEARQGSDPKREASYNKICQPYLAVPRSPRLLRTLGVIRVRGSYEALNLIWYVILFNYRLVYICPIRYPPSTCIFQVIYSTIIMADNILPKDQRIQLAVTCKYTFPYRSITSIAFQFDVSKSTLQYRLNGRQSQTLYHIST